jgi:Organic solvent tolerance protein OstA
VKYTDISLKGEKIWMNMDSSLVYATYGIDSVGKEFGFPVFTDGGTDYESKTMKYNFKTKKGYITNVITTQGEGYIVASRAKKNDDNSFFMREGKYTTCDDHEHPHFYLALTKAKVRPKKNVVTGPAYLVIEDLPLPIGLPFGFFPFSEKYSSGVIMPSYGDELARGFNLRDGGYYFAINDNIDLAVTGEIYTKGSGESMPAHHTEKGISIRGDLM